jgi:glycosyltransferase involved in cell wall biosynthesis
VAALPQDVVILEALSERAPVIVRNLGGMPEIVQESGGGLIYNTDEELVAAMDQLAADPSARNEMGQRGHTTYTQKLTADAHLERYFELIRGIAATRRPLRT